MCISARQSHRQGHHRSARRTTVPQAGRKLQHGPLPQLFVTDADTPFHGGRLDVDFEICEAPGKGFGVFALRDFQPNEVLMAERPLFMLSGRQLATQACVVLTGEELAAFWELLPEDGDMFKKFRTNAFHCPDAVPEESEGIFLAQARVNHDCVGNCIRYYCPEQGAQRLIAMRAIQAGEEVTSSYLWVGAHAQHPWKGLPSTQAERHAALRRTWKFFCACDACTSLEVAEKIDELESLGAGMTLARLEIWNSQGLPADDLDALLHAGEVCLQLIHELRLGSEQLSRMNRDLFAVAASRKSTVPAAMRYAAASAAHGTAIFGQDATSVADMTKYAERPELFTGYCAADRT